jgi:hypothetical protein
MQNKEDKELVKRLSVLKPGFLPYEVFIQIARLVALPIVELVPFRKNSRGEAEVLLLARSKNDEIWPDKLHSPGTVLRADDAEQGIDTAFQRIQTDELAGTRLGDPVFVMTQFYQSSRGAEYAQIYFAKVQEEPRAGAFYPIGRLPENIVPEQVGFIKKAAESFQASEG